MSREGNQKMVIWIVAISLVAIILVVAAIMFGQQDGPPTFSTSFGSGKPGNNVGEFNQPVGVTVSPQGSIFVLESKLSRVQRLDPEGNVLDQWGSLGTKERQFDEPLRLAADSAGNLWIADTGNHRIQWFSAAGEFQGAFGQRGGEPGEFSHPVGLAFDSNNNLYVADCLNHRIQKIGRQLNVLQVYPEKPDKSSAIGFLNAPWGVALDPQDTVYVADTGNHRIVRFANDGRYLDSFGSRGTEEGQFNDPRAIVFDVDGNLVVVDSGNNRLQKFTPQGKFMYAWGQPGVAGGMFNNPQQAAIASDATMYVADSGNHRVQKFLPRRKRTTSTSPLVGPTRPVFQPDNRVGDPDQLPPAQGLPEIESAPPSAPAGEALTPAEGSTPPALDPGVFDAEPSSGEL